MASVWEGWYRCIKKRVFSNNSRKSWTFKSIVTLCMTNTARYSSLSQLCLNKAEHRDQFSEKTIIKQKPHYIMANYLRQDDKQSLIRTIFLRIIGYFYAIKWGLIRDSKKTSHSQTEQTLQQWNHHQLPTLKWKQRYSKNGTQNLIALFFCKPFNLTFHQHRLKIESTEKSHCTNPTIQVHHKNKLAVWDTLVVGTATL